MYTLSTMIAKYIYLVCNRAIAIVIELIMLILVVIIEMSIHTENSKRNNHHGVACSILKRKCHSVLLKMNTYKNLCMTKLFYLQVKK